MDEILQWTTRGCEGAERKGGGVGGSLYLYLEDISQWVTSTWNNTTFHFAIITTGKGFENFLFSLFFSFQKKKKAGRGKTSPLKHFNYFLF
jgi:hypothetical protein